MEKKFIEVNGIQLAYVEKNTEKSLVLFFIHGNSSSSALWKKQLNSDLFSNYRLLAIDLPAHGDSDACFNPKHDYSPICTAQILSKAVKQLTGTDPYVLIGFSYGTNLIAEMLAHGLSPKGIAFTGACIVGENHGPAKVLLDPASNIFLEEDISLERAKSFFDKHLYGAEEIDIQYYLHDFFSVKPLFRSFMIQSALSGNHTDEILALQKQSIPLLIVLGQNDNLIHINYLDDASLPLWKNAIFKLPGTGHFVQTDQPEVFNQLLFEYVTDRFK